MAIVDKRLLCLDTSVLIAFLRDSEPGAESVVRAVKNFDCGVTSITSYELLFGVHRSRKEIGENALLGRMSIWALDDEAARRAARLHADLIGMNRDIGIKDVFIASICLLHSLPILTLNAQHFSRVPGLTVYTPSTLPASA